MGFVNSDPARDGLNWFAYASNPVSFADPSGFGSMNTLNVIQTGLAVLGFVPVIGAVADIVNAGISVGRGNYGEAALSLAAAVPGIGDTFAAGKIATVAVGAAVAARSVRAVSAPVVTAARVERAVVRTALPELHISAGKYPDLAENILNAQRAGHQDVLTHGGEAVINANRNAALHQPYRDFVPNIGKGVSRDEYPFASSLQGGAGSWVGHIPVGQQQAQGGLIRAMNLKPGNQYRVVIVP
jgi:hypothetical protein